MLSQGWSIVLLRLNPYPQFAPGSLGFSTENLIYNMHPFPLDSPHSNHPVLPEQEKELRNICEVHGPAAELRVVPFTQCIMLDFNKI